jgi:hypothetical protein
MAGSTSALAVVDRPAAGGDDHVTGSRVAQAAFISHAGV